MGENMYFLRREKGMQGTALLYIPRNTGVVCKYSCEVSSPVLSDRSD